MTVVTTCSTGDEAPEARNEQATREACSRSCPTDNSTRDTACTTNKHLSVDLEHHFKSVVIRSFEEILEKKPKQPMKLIVDRLLESSHTHEIENHHFIVGDDTECIFTKACTYKRGADSLRVGNLPLLRLIAPSSFEIEAALRSLSATTAPGANLLVFVEPPDPSTDLFFLRGTPYFADVTKQLLKRRRGGNPDRILDNCVCSSGIVASIGSALRLSVRTLQEEISEISSTAPQWSFVELPQTQSNFFEAFHVLDAALHPRAHDCVRPLAVSSVPGVLLVSYNVPKAPMTFSRVIAAVLPLYEDVQRQAVAGILSANKARIRQLDFCYVMNYWKEVLQRRDARDKARGVSVAVTKSTVQKKVRVTPGRKAKVSTFKAPKDFSARIQRRECEDAMFLRVIQRLQSDAVVRIQALYRGYRVRRKYGSRLRARLLGRSPPHTLTCWVEDLPISTPPLLRRCMERLSKVHGEIFGNYACSCPPVPRTVTILKPTRTVIKDSAKNGSGDDGVVSDVDSESETWEEERVVVPMKRQTDPPPHFNVLRRLMECEYSAQCNTVKYASNIQLDYAGVSVLQRRAYDAHKSLVLNLLHIAYLELYRRGCIPLTVRDFEGFVNHSHLEVFAWFSVPHVFSRITLGRVVRAPHPVAVVCSREIMEKERVLICGACVCNESNEVALSQATVICDKDDVGADDYKEEPCSETADAPSLVQPVEKVEENELDLSDVYVVPAFLPQERWEETLRNLAGEDLEAKVAWWSLLDSPAAYVNGKPVVLYPRHELQWVEGRPGFDELVPCIDVIQKAPVYVPEVEEVVGNETVTPTPCSCTVNESSEISASHISLEKDCKSWRSEPDSPDCARTNPDEGDGCAFSVFDAPLSVEDLYLSSELKESYQEKGTKKIPHYNTLGPVAEYGIPAPVYGLQPLVLMSDSLGGALPNKSGIITNSFVEVGSAAGDTMPREMSFALGNEAEQGPLADGAEWEHADGASCRYSDKPIASAFSPSEKVSAEHSATPVVETVSAMAMLVAQRSLPEGFFAHRRPWFTPICSRARAATFAEFMIGVLHQLRAGCKVVVAAEDPYQIMFFNAVCLLKLAAKEEDRLEDTASSSMSLRDVDNSAVPMHENLSGGTGGWLSLLKTFYEEVGKIVNTTAVSVDECAVTVQNVMRKASPGGLIFLEQIPSLMQRVEGETDERLMRESILTIVQRIELYYWLVLFQVFLVSILKSQSTSMRIETSLAKFHVFVNDPHILRLLDQIDPWRDVPQRSPDPLHLRYSNGLRRWEQQHFIFRGATSL